MTFPQSQLSRLHDQNEAQMYGCERHAETTYDARQELPLSFASVKRRLPCYASPAGPPRHAHRLLIVYIQSITSTSLHIKSILNQGTTHNIDTQKRQECINNKYQQHYLCALILGSRASTIPLSRTTGNQSRQRVKAVGWGGTRTIIS